MLLFLLPQNIELSCNFFVHKVLPWDQLESRDVHTVITAGNDNVLKPK